MGIGPVVEENLHEGTEGECADIPHHVAEVVGACVHGCAIEVCPRDLREQVIFIALADGPAEGGYRFGHAAHTKDPVIQGKLDETEKVPDTDQLSGLHPVDERYVPAIEFGADGVEEGGAGCEDDRE